MNLNKLLSFADTFREFEGDYIVIGGHACALHYHNVSATFRATEDIDVVIVLEKWSERFNEQFSSFIHTHKYRISKIDIQDGQNKNVAYRFQINKTQSDSYNIPMQIELFCKKDFLTSPTSKEHIVALPTFDNTSALGAILTNEECYQFIIQSRIMLSTVSTVTAECLLCLKAFAYIDNLKLLKDGKLNASQQFDADKHALDVCGLINFISTPFSVLPAALVQAIQQTISNLEDEKEYDRLSSTYNSTQLTPSIAKGLQELLSTKNLN